MPDGSVGDISSTGDAVLERGEGRPIPEEQLHARCGVYTKAAPAARILDAVGWTAKADLSRARLLEPSAGDGAFVIAAIGRLISSFRGHGLPLSAETLGPRIVAVELLEREAHVARTTAAATLSEAGLSSIEAMTIASIWIRTGDFLLDPPTGEFTHVVGNPPYCRWSRIPASLKAAYERVLKPDVAKGDIFLPFLDLGIECLSKDGVLGFICSDRWKYMGFAQDFRERRMPGVEIVRDRAVVPEDAFMRPVDAYSSELIIRKRTLPKTAPKRRKRSLTLQEAGYRVRVGPALGCTPAYVVGPEAAKDIEPELLTPWVDGRDVGSTGMRPASRFVVTMHGRDGKLIELDQFPGALAHLERHRSSLEARAIVQVSRKIWYSPIDRVLAEDWSRPKLLVPELAKEPRVALDLTGAIPSHGVYAVFAPDDDLASLLFSWREGGLAKALKGKAPMVKGGYVRCYKRFLEALPAPIG